TSGAVTLRQVIAYGDGGLPSQSAADRDAARVGNLLGQLSMHYDEAGLSIVHAFDFKSNVVEKSRRVIADAPILAMFSRARAANWRVTPFHVDWQPTGQSLAEVETALLETTSYRTNATYDALNRIKRLQFPHDIEGKRRELRSSYNSAGRVKKIWFDEA